MEQNNKFTNLVNEFISNSGADKPIICDDECEKNKQENKLYQNYLKAQKTKETAPEDLDDAERNFYVYRDGDYKYNKMIENKYSDIGKKMKNKYENKYLNSYADTERIANVILQQSTYSKNMDSLADKYKTSVNKLNNTIDETETSTNIANRNTYYYNQYNVFFEDIRYIFYWINIVITILFIILAYFYNKLSERKYKFISIGLILNLFIPYKTIVEYFIN